MRTIGAEQARPRTIRPLAALLALLCWLGEPWASSSARDLPVQSVKSAGTTYARAQVLHWVDDTTFAIGRWDGTLAVFRTPTAGEFGPVVTQAMAAPSGRGIEMIRALDELTFVSSDGPERLAVWRRASAGAHFAFVAKVPFDPAFGGANSGTTLTLDGQAFFASGHENGRVVLWKPSQTAGLELVTVMDVRSANPIPSPYPLKNVRGLVPWRGNHLVAGSEDGDVVGLKLPEGKEVFRARYNAEAKRGINSLSILGDWLLLSNCSVGQTDKNIWLYDLSGGKLLLRDAENLILDTQRSQIFNFDADLMPGKDGPVFFSSTEEGLLWQGKVDDDQLVVTGVTRIAPDGGAILDISPNRMLLAAAAHQIWLFKPE